MSDQDFRDTLRFLLDNWDKPGFQQEVERIVDMRRCPCGELAGRDSDQLCDQCNKCEITKVMVGIYGNK